MSIDRAKLEEAIAAARDWSLNEDGAVMERFFGAEELGLLCKAAGAHLATLPKTKTVEVWHVCYAGPVDTYGEMKVDKWQPFVEIKLSEAAAKAHAVDLKHIAGCRYVTVTGPHQQEVPT